MKKYTMYLTVLVLLFAACSSPEDDPQPDPPVPSVYETTITVGTVPESVKVETSTSIKFTVAQQEHTENFTVEVDTVVPNYWQGKIFDEDGKPIYYRENIFGSANIQINETALASLTTIAPNVENTITFANPTAVGEYTIKLKITDKNSKSTTKEIVVKVVSPEIEIRWYNKYILGYYWEPEVMYEKLNQDFSFNPLSASLAGTRCDTIYTSEEPKSGYPGEVTYPGKTFLVHVAQEGGEPMQYVRGMYNYLLNEDGYLSTTDWHHSIDGLDSWGFGVDFGQGFHGIRFETTTLTRVGTMFYTIRVVDKWGKEHIATLPYKCFAMGETIPSHCTPDVNLGWWYHKIND